MIIRGIIVFVSLFLIWQAIVSVLQLPVYILPGPFLVIHTWISQYSLLFHQTIPTLLETVIGLILGIFFGCIIALLMSLIKPVRYWVMPLLLISQALPTFAIAPLLVIWFGYGMASKIVTTILMLFYPVTSSFFDGLRRTDSAWLDLAQTMNASRWRILWFIRVPAALPALASGIRVATAIAPIGAVIGEWVGASSGLGFLMLNANARMQIDVMFAALVNIILLSLILYFCVDKLLKKLIFWQVEK
jgi:putative hydroxymethylpyrimidine transport system permease protein